MSDLLFGHNPQMVIDGNVNIKFGLHNSKNIWFYYY